MLRRFSFRQPFIVAGLIIACVTLGTEANAQDAFETFSSRTETAVSQLELVIQNAYNVERAEVIPFQSAVGGACDLMVEIATHDGLSDPQRKTLLGKIIPTWTSAMTALTDPYVDLDASMDLRRASGTWIETLTAKVGVFFSNLYRDVASAFIPYSFVSSEWTVPDSWFRFGAAAKRTEVLGSTAKTLLSHLKRATQSPALDESQTRVLQLLANLAAGIEHTEPVHGYGTHQWMRRTYFFLAILFHLKPPVFLTFGDVTYGAVEFSSYTYLAGFLMLARARRVNSGMDLGTLSDKILRTAAARGVSCESAFSKPRKGWQ